MSSGCWQEGVWFSPWVTVRLAKKRQGWGGGRVMNQELEAESGGSTFLGREWQPQDGDPAWPMRQTAKERGDQELGILFLSLFFEWGKLGEDFLWVCFSGWVCLWVWDGQRRVEWATPLEEHRSRMDLTTHRTSTFNHAHMTLFPSGPLCGFHLRPVWLQSPKSDSEYCIRARGEHLPSPSLHSGSSGWAGHCNYPIWTERKRSSLSWMPVDWIHSPTVCLQHSLTTLMGTSKSLSWMLSYDDLKFGASHFSW